MAELKFTNEQRLIISLLCDVLREPKKRDFRPETIELISTAICNGHDWAIDWELSGIFPSEADTKDDVSFVADTLDMWSFIELRWTRLSPAEQGRVRDATNIINKPEFLGFDGNNETDYMAIARMLIETMGRFQNFKGRELNSHLPVSGRYREMLHHWPAIRRSLADSEMSVEQMIILLKRV